MMRSIAALKTLPYIGLALYAFFRALPGNKDRKVRAAKEEASKGEINGQVSKVLKEADGFLVLLNVGKDGFWVYAEGEFAPVGAKVSLTLGKCIDAYESKSLGMAFEKVHLIRRWEHLTS